MRICVEITIFVAMKKFELDELINEAVIDDLKKEEVSIEQTEPLTPDEWYRKCYDDGYGHMLAFYAENLCGDAGLIGNSIYDDALRRLSHKICLILDMFSDRRSDVQLVNTSRFYSQVTHPSEHIQFEWPGFNFNVQGHDNTDGFLHENHNVSDCIVKIAFDFRKSPVHFLTMCAALSSLKVNFLTPESNEYGSFCVYRRKDENDNSHPFIKTNLFYGNNLSCVDAFVPSLRILRTLTPEFYRKNLDAGIYCHSIVASDDNYLSNNLYGIIAYNGLSEHGMTETKTIIKNWLTRNYPAEEFKKLMK